MLRSFIRLIPSQNVQKFGRFGLGSAVASCLQAFKDGVKVPRIFARWTFIGFRLPG